MVLLLGRVKKWISYFLSFIGPRIALDWIGLPVYLIIFFYGNSLVLDLLSLLIHIMVKKKFVAVKFKQICQSFQTP